MFWFFSCEAYGILAPQPGTEPAPPALEGEVLHTGLTTRQVLGQASLTMGSIQVTGRPDYERTLQNLAEIFLKVIPISRFPIT